MLFNPGKHSNRMAYAYIKTYVKYKHVFMQVASDELKKKGERRKRQRKEPAIKFHLVGHIF